MKLKQKFLIPVAVVMLAGGAVTGIATFASADTGVTQNSPQTERTKPAALGMVTAISGSRITLTDPRTSTTYTVDASTATIMKQAKPLKGEKPDAPTEAAVGDIVVGDMLAVEGSINGSVVTATRIHDGIMGGHERPGPGIGGTVTAIDGSTLTVTGMDGKTYTVSTTDATVSKMTTIAVSDIAVGDAIGIEGTLDGTTITASHIRDGMKKELRQSK